MLLSVKCPYPKNREGVRAPGSLRWRILLFFFCLYDWLRSKNHQHRKSTTPAELQTHWARALKAFLVAYPAMDGTKVVKRRREWSNIMPECADIPATSHENLQS